MIKKYQDERFERNALTAVLQKKVAAIIQPEDICSADFIGVLLDSMIFCISQGYSGRRGDDAG